MGSDIKDNTVFLEFYGLPGSGKSTISHLVAEELRKQGKTVKEPTYDTDHRYSGGVRKGIKLLKLIRYVLVSPKKYKSIKKLIKENGYTGLDVISQVANIAPKLWEYDHARADYVLFDEGLTQSAISLVKNEGSSSENERTLYNLCKQRRVRKLFIKVSPETAIMRMARRDKHDSRIETIKDEVERDNALREIERQCNAISSGIVIEEENIQPAVNSIIRQIGLRNKHGSIHSTS